MADESERSLTGHEPADSFDAVLQQVARVPIVASRMHLSVGSRLLAGRFQILRPIGEGGMGVVYEALDAERAAASRSRPLRRSTRQVYRLKNEFRALAGVSHPNLVQLHELFAESDRGSSRWSWSTASASTAG